MTAFSRKLAIVLVGSWLIVTAGGDAAPADEKGGQTQKNPLSVELTGLTGSQLVLELNGAEWLTLSKDGPSAFPIGLAVGEPYAVKIASLPLNHACVVENGEGTVGAEKSETVQVRCRPTGLWLHPSSLKDSLSLAGQNAREPAVALEDHGKGIVVWSQFDGGNWRIYLAEYRDDKWQAPQGPSAALSPPGGEARQPSVAMAANGDAVVVWQQKVGERSHIYMAEKRGGKWRKPAALDDHISPGKSYAWEANVAMDDDGSAIIVWDQEYAEGFHLVYKSEYRRGVWRHPVSVEEYLAFPGGDGLRPQVVMNKRGEALITWEQDPGGVSRIYKSEYRGGKWLHPVDVDDQISLKGENAHNAMAVLSDSGPAVIAWQQRDGSSSRIYKSERRDGSWQHPNSPSEAISPLLATSATLNSMAMDSGGNTVVLWSLQEGRNQELFMSEFRNGAWRHPAADDFIVGSKREFEFKVLGKVGMADSGKSLIGWHQMGEDRIVRLFMQEYDNGRWYMPGKQISLGEGPTAGVAVAASPKGSLIIVWIQNDGAFDRLYKSEFRPVKK